MKYKYIKLSGLLDLPGPNLSHKQKNFLKGYGETHTLATLKVCLIAFLSNDRRCMTIHMTVKFKNTKDYQEILKTYRREKGYL